MRKPLLSFLVALFGTAAGGAALAQPPEAELEATEAQPPEAPAQDQEGFPYGPPPIPPTVEQEAVTTSGGGYCYMGGHPVDTRVAPGAAWDDQLGAHIHFYPPVDMRLFAFRDGCYTFIGDPV